MKAIAIVAGAMALLAALVVASTDWVISAFLGVPAAVLLLALFKEWWRIQVAG